MPAEYTYDYAIIRVVPRVERGESINVGVILSCPDVEFLEARIELDASRLLALDATLDLEATRASLDTIPVICRGGDGAGPLGELPQRFKELDPNTDMVVHCKSGMRSARAVNFLRDKGYARAKNLKGGVLSWIDTVDPSQPKY